MSYPLASADPAFRAGDAQEQKTLLRPHWRTVRGAIDTAQRERAAQAIIPHALSFLPPPPCAVAAYWSVRGEMDCKPLLQHLHSHGYICLLPVIDAPARPLIFRQWSPRTPMQQGAFAIAAPGADAPACDPQVIFAPLLAYDRRGYRLGYGGGFYDRTLQSLRAKQPVTCVGVAFAAQESPPLPVSDHDMRLDAIINEKEVVRVTATTGAARSAPAGDGTMAS